jgi:folate-binding protein YgfZ
MSEHLPLHDLHLAAGATMAAVDGFELPVSYGDPAAEYAAAREGVGLVDRGHAGVLEVTGRDGAAFLHAMLSNDVKSLVPGQGCAATLLDVHGKVQVTLTVLALAERMLVLAPPGMAAPTLDMLDKYLFSEKADFKDVTGELAILGLVGPEAAATVERLAGTRVGEVSWSHAEGVIDGTTVRLVHGAGEMGAPDVWVLGPVGEGPALWRAARAAGARPVGLTAQESLRIEAGTPLYGQDVDATVLLPEIPHAHLVSHSKGCYIGQEVVVRIRDRGHVNRQLRGLVLEGRLVPERGVRVLAGGAEIGRVTSATWSLGLGRPIARGFVRREHGEPGTAVTVRAGQDDVAARVTALPFPR